MAESDFVCDYKKDKKEYDKYFKKRSKARFRKYGKKKTN